jgi:hypothetical protein
VADINSYYASAGYNQRVTGKSAKYLGVSTAFQMGLTNDQIRLLGRWRSVDTPQHYRNVDPGALRHISLKLASALKPSHNLDGTERSQVVREPPELDREGLPVRGLTLPVPHQSTEAVHHQGAMTEHSPVRRDVRERSPVRRDVRERSPVRREVRERSPIRRDVRERSPVRRDAATQTTETRNFCSRCQCQLQTQNQDHRVLNQRQIHRQPQILSPLRHQQRRNAEVLTVFPVYPAFALPYLPEESDLQIESTQYTSFDLLDN